jgi:hypothetical protein
MVDQEKRCVTKRTMPPRRADLSLSTKGCIAVLGIISIQVIELELKAQAPHRRRRARHRSRPTLSFARSGFPIPYRHDRTGIDVQ